MTAPLLLLALLSLARALTVVPASDPRVRWVGRTNASARDGSVAFDYEGVSATITITSPWTFLSVTISDQCAGSASLGGGSRWLVTATPADARADAWPARLDVLERPACFGVLPVCERWRRLRSLLLL